MSFESGSSPGTTTGMPGSVIRKVIKATGAIIHIESWDFTQLLLKTEQPVVIKAKAGLLRNYYQYMTTYKGFIVFTRSRQELDLPANVELINAKEIWLPE